MIPTLYSNIFLKSTVKLKKSLSDSFLATGGSCPLTDILLNLLVSQCSPITEVVDTFLNLDCDVNLVKQCLH